MAGRVREAKQNEEKEESKRVYCGPNLPGLSQFTVLSGMPKFIKIHIQSCPAIEKLIVPIENLNTTRLKLVVKGSYEQKMYFEIKKYLGGVNSEL